MAVPRTTTLRYWVSIPAAMVLGAVLLSAVITQAMSSYRSVGSWRQVRRDTDKKQEPRYQAVSCLRFDRLGVAITHTCLLDTKEGRMWLFLDKGSPDGPRVPTLWPLPVSKGPAEQTPAGQVGLDDWIAPGAGGAAPQPRPGGLSYDGVMRPPVPAPRPRPGELSDADVFSAPPPAPADNSLPPGFVLDKAPSPATPAKPR